MPIEFNHSASHLSEALGFSQEQVEDVHKKLANLSLQQIKEKENFTQSKTCEEIAKIFSYKELLYIATAFVTERTVDLIKNNPVLLLSIIKED